MERNNLTKQKREDQTLPPTSTSAAVSIAHDLDLHEFSPPRTTVLSFSPTTVSSILLTALFFEGVFLSR
jgi:hypothetical protein